MNHPKIINLLLIFSFLFYDRLNLSAKGITPVGGLCIVFEGDPIVIKSLRILETDWAVKSPKEKIVVVQNFKPGVYSLFIEKQNSNSNISIKTIQISKDSLSIVVVPNEIENKDVDWQKTNKKGVSKILATRIVTKTYISGKVLDAVSGMPIENAIVVIEQCPWWGTTTGIDGKYCIESFFSGQFTVSANQNYYRKDKIINVRVGEDSVSSVDFYLHPISIPESRIVHDWVEKIGQGSCILNNKTIYKKGKDDE